MEWGIKLKNKDNKKNKLLKQTFWSFISQVAIATVSIPIVFYISLLIIVRLDFQWLYDFFPNFYNFSRYYLINLSMIIIIVIIIWVTVVLILLYRLLKKVFSYVNALSDASDELMNNNIEYIELPKELEDIQNKMNSLKRESEKNEKLARENEQKKDELIVYLAHDIKTPLTSMIGYLSILDEIDDMPKKKQKKYTSIALEKSYRLEELINELFDIARFNSEKIVLEKEELNLNLMIEQIIDDFYPILKELNKEIQFDTKEDIRVFADPDKLSRVFTNLIKNAINYSKEESKITINAKKNNANITVDIVNKGKQIPKEKLDRLFEKFYRLDSSRTSKTGGSGLGLAIAKEIIKLHGGIIIAKSNEEETTFHVELPIK